MKTISSATTKSELVEMIKGISLTKVKKADAGLADRVKYALGVYAKDDKKVTKNDLMSLIAEMNKALTMPASADTKKESPKTQQKEKPKAALKKKDEPKVENLIKKPAGKKSEETKEEPKKLTKKPEDKKPAPKKDEAKKTPDKKPLQTTLDEARVKFPASVTIETEEGDVEYNLASGKFKSFKELEKYLSDEDNPSVVIVVPTTKQQARERNYGLGLLSLPKDGFPNDLDVYIPIYVGQNNSVVAVASLYTDEVLCLIDSGKVDDIEEVNGIRYAGSLAYQIYVEAIL